MTVGHPPPRSHGTVSLFQELPTAGQGSVPHPHIPAHGPLRPKHGILGMTGVYPYTHTDVDA